MLWFVLFDANYEFCKRQVAMVISRDRKWKKHRLHLIDPDEIGPSKLDSPEKVRVDPILLTQSIFIGRFLQREVAGFKTKRVVFIRHGESVWNEIFNKSKVMLVPRLLKSICIEIAFMVTRDSVFLDSPLNAEGTEQCRILVDFFEQDATVESVPDANQNEYGDSDGSTLSVAEWHAICRGSCGYDSKSVLASSNLRRALCTATVALWGRLQRTGEKMCILSCGQEISRNIDTLATSVENVVPTPGEHELASLLQQQAQKGMKTATRDDMYNVRQNFGNKVLWPSEKKGGNVRVKSSGHGMMRLEGFCEWSFGQKEDCVILGGHSLWFRNAFQALLPRSSTHAGKTCKVKNCGVVAFTLVQAKHSDGEMLYRIIPESIVEVHAGFEQPKKKKD
jgi:hypothetical protein